jgi:hypothetical protein
MPSAEVKLSSRADEQANRNPHRAKGLVDPKVRTQKRLLILDTPEHVNSENIKLKIGYRPSLHYQLFSKRDLTDGRDERHDYYSMVRFNGHFLYIAI